MATKTFKIGEECFGGILKVYSENECYVIKALDYNTKKVLGTFCTVERGVDRNQIESALCHWTTSYHADRICEWIFKK
jgi:hypothetical protein